MKNLTKLVIGLIFAVFAAAICISVFVGLSGSKISERDKDDLPDSDIGLSAQSDSIQRVGEQNKDSNADKKSETNAIDSPGTEQKRVTKYILKYDGNGIYSITDYPGGETVSKRVDNINPKYLTESDIEKLKKGIETDSLDEMYKLIEDFSS